MSNALDNIKAAMVEYQQAKAVVNEKVKANLAKAFVDFFDQNPLIKVIGWAQYTPYFNDGDACVFSVGEVGFGMDDKDIGEDPYEYTKIAKPHEYTLSAAAEGKDYAVEAVAKWEALCAEHGEAILNQTDANCKELSNLLEHIDDQLEEMFGDGVQVVVTRSGIDTEEYEHD